MGVIISIILISSIFLNFTITDFEMQKEEYEISLMLMSARWDYIAPVWESDMTNKTSYSFGYPAAHWCCQDASDQMQWKVRAIINGEPQEWSDTWIFTFQDFIYPNQKDQELLNKAGGMKPTV